MNSWPIRFPVSLCFIELYGQRSLPQMQARVTMTIESVGSMSRASGTVSTRTSLAPYIHNSCSHIEAVLLFLLSSGLPRSALVARRTMGPLVAESISTPDHLLQVLGVARAVDLDL
jgi:hypothetical protein